MNIVRRTTNIVFLLPEVICVIVISLVTIILFLAVIFRYFLHLPLGWTEELSRLLFIWITFFGAAIAAKKGTHTRFELLMSKISPKLKAEVNIIGSFFLIAINLFFVYAGLRAFKIIGYEKFVILGLPYSLAYIALPIGASLMFIYYLRDFIHDIKIYFRTHLKKL